MVKRIKVEGFEYDAIAVRGVSGLMVGGILSLRLNKPLVVVRKTKGEHSEHIVEGVRRDGMRYLIVDDLVCSGATVNDIMAQIEAINHGAQCVGVVVYEEYRDKVRREGLFKGREVRVYSCWA